ncbi:sulfurtransferase [Streptomyces sp. NBC_00102]|uniref:sulfurtransferase n=1 Tax=Streptomyces sp. NBC_00102 TaxID=2975652 RepID=UPI0022504356|nr:rhodanese-like domain-containing protein [Streptomyces sp. NBC_00102]MCX5396674.1 rhodanese-like domain-containing protein [Streptomyces sp. NBC_00102]
MTTETGARGAVITAGQLLELLERPGDGRGPVLLEIGREPADAPEAADRLPGAHYVALSTQLAGERRPDSGRYPLPGAEEIQRQVRRWGIDADTVVVVHTRTDLQLATRAWFVLTWAGVPDVRVLDGGLDAWVAAGGPLGSGEPAEGGGTFTVTTGSLPTLDAEKAAGLARSGTLIDARPTAAYTGVEGGGHIPGALNVPAAAHLGPDGRLKGLDELRERYAALGAVEGADIGLYCGGGVAATLGLFVLDALGMRARLYPGSWSEWSNDPSRPVASGEGPG